MTPAISQCPRVVSLAGDNSAHLPYAPLATGSGGTPRIGRIFPKPSLPRFGRCTPSGKCSERFPSVLAPISPNASASGRAPAPTLSRTITITRLAILAQDLSDGIARLKAKDFLG